MENSPDEKPLQTTSFVIHSTRGLIRDQNMRRKTMFVLLIVALVLLVCGSTFLQSILAPKEHPGWFIFFWVICGWFALTAMLLAIFDMLLVKRAERQAARELRVKLSDEDETER